MHPGHGGITGAKGTALGSACSGARHPRGTPGAGTQLSCSRSCWESCAGSSAASRNDFLQQCPRAFSLGTEQPVPPRVHHPAGIPDEAVAREPGVAELSKGSLLLTVHCLPVAEQSKASTAAELSPAVTPSTAPAPLTWGGSPGAGGIESSPLAECRQLCQEGSSRMPREREVK